MSRSEETGDMLRKSEKEDELLIQTAVERLYYWIQGGDSFTCQLYALMAKADTVNFRKFWIAFPIEVSAYVAWKNSPSQQMFFQMYGLGPKREKAV